MDELGQSTLDWTSTDIEALKRIRDRLNRRIAELEYLKGN
jgi:hypothetical protein